MAAAIVSFYGYYHIKYLERQKPKTLDKQNIEMPKEQNQLTPTKPVVSYTEPMASLTNNNLKTPVSGEIQDDGLGIFTPNFGEQKVLYFYSNLNL